jgi:ABC-type multidrug transport system permease subunit
MVNLSIFDDTNNLYEVIFQVNNETNGAFALFTLASVFFLVMIIFQARYEFKRILLYDTFLLSILSFLFFLISWISFDYVIFAVVMLFFTAIFNKLS